MKKNIRNIKASVRAQLLNMAKETNCPFSEILQYYGMERFLYRLSCSKYVDKFILKGALMFTVWQVPERRTTMDIDLSARYDNEIKAIEKVIRDVCEIMVTPDGLVFNSGTVNGQKTKEGADYEGIRVKFKGFLERSRIAMQVDIGFGDTIYPKPKKINYPVLLDLPKPRLKGYPPESVLSEKFEAMIKLGLLNSRMKDFYDVWNLICQFDFDGLDLVESLKRTFKQRKTVLPKGKPFFADEIYDEKSDRQTLWKAFLIKGDIKHAPEKLRETGRVIEEFLIELLDANSKKQEFCKKWKARDSWK